MNIGEFRDLSVVNMASDARKEPERPVSDASGKLPRVELTAQFIAHF